MQPEASIINHFNVSSEIHSMLQRSKILVEYIKCQMINVP